jgi:hypothetical protein
MQRAETWDEVVYTQRNTWDEEPPVRLASELAVVLRDGSIRGVKLA